jgi:hypothetical protein
VRRIAASLLFAPSVFFVTATLVRSALAQNATPRAVDAPPLAPDTPVEVTTNPPEGKITPPARDFDVAPPVRPRPRGVVLETTAGILGFGGQFRHVAPPAFWMHAQLGFEPLAWLMLFAASELAFTDTSEAEDASHARAFWLWGFGGGLRAGIQPSDRVALFVQGEAGGLTANVPRRALANLGFPQAEMVSFQFGGRVGAVWYQIDRHLALTASAGARVAEGFSKLFAANDIPLLWDASVGWRYAF